MHRSGCLILCSLIVGAALLGGCVRHRPPKVIHAPMYSYLQDGIALTDPIAADSAETATMAKLPPAPQAPGFDRHATRGAGSRGK